MRAMGTGLHCAAVILGCCSITACGGGDDNDSGTEPADTVADGGSAGQPDAAITTGLAKIHTGRIPGTEVSGRDQRAFVYKTVATNDGLYMVLRRIDNSHGTPVGVISDSVIKLSGSPENPDNFTSATNQDEAIADFDVIDRDSESPGEVAIVWVNGDRYGHINQNNGSASFEITNDIKIDRIAAGFGEPTLVQPWIVGVSLDISDRPKDADASFVYRHGAISPELQTTSVVYRQAVSSQAVNATRPQDEGFFLTEPGGERAFWANESSVTVYSTTRDPAFVHVVDSTGQPRLLLQMEWYDDALWMVANNGRLYRFPTDHEITGNAGLLEDVAALSNFGRIATRPGQFCLRNGLIYRSDGTATAPFAQQSFSWLAQGDLSDEESADLRAFRVASADSIYCSDDSPGIYVMGHNASESTEDGDVTYGTLMMVEPLAPPADYDSSPAPSTTPQPTPSASPAPSPAPTLPPDSSSGSGTASGQMKACFNADLFRTGAMVSLRYRDNLIGDYTARYQVLGSGSFNGHDGIRLEATTSGISSTRYRQQDESIPQTAQIGEIFESGAAAGTSIGYEPPAIFRYDLNAGDDYDQTYTFINGSVRTTVELHTEFAGIETITVSAGTFEACRIQQTSQIDGQTNNRTLWLATGSGILVRDILNGSEAELLSGTVNGENVR